MESFSFGTKINQSILNSSPLGLSELQKEIESGCSSIKELYHEDKLFQAYLLWHRVKISLNHYRNHSPSTMDKLQSLLQEESLASFCTSLEAEKEETHKFLHHIETEEGWSLTKEVNGVKAYYRRETSSATHSVKLEGIMNSPLMNILTVTLENELYNSWIPYLTQSELLGEHSPFKKFIWMNLAFPFPLYGRDACLKGYGVDLSEHGAVLISVRSCKPCEREHHNHREVCDNTVRIDCHLGGALLQPISATQTKVFVLGNIDPKVYIPYWLLNLGTKRLVHYLFDIFEEKSNTLPLTEEFQKKFRQKEQMYSLLRQRIEKHFHHQMNHQTIYPKIDEKCKSHKKRNKNKLKKKSQTANA